MTERSQRRAAERNARKAEQKRQRNLSQTQPLPATLPSETAAISEAQLAANRANSALSTGPITAEGKAISSRNRFSHGLTQAAGDPVLLASESKEEYAQSLAAYQDEWQPATPTERDLVNRLVSHCWLRRRALNLQRNFLHPESGLIIDEKQFNLYRRYEVQHERAYNKAFSDLMRIRAQRIREQNGFESQRRKNEKHSFQMRHLQHREKMYMLKEATAEARLVLAQSKLVNTPAAGGQPLQASAQ